MLLYRIQHTETDKGMWQTLSAEGKPLVTYLSNQVMATMPMPDSDIYGTAGRRWYSSANSLELLHMWFSPADILELIALGFEVFEVEASEVQHLPNEVIFTKESVTSWTNITSNYTKPEPVIIIESDWGSYPRFRHFSGPPVDC